MELNILYPKDFIEISFIKNLSQLIPSDANQGLSYEAFILVGIAIEFLGSTMDNYTWHEQGKSKKRFMVGLKLLGPRYEAVSELLYKKLRCGMAHVYAPVLGLGLGERKHNTMHLSEYYIGGPNHMVLLEVESLYFDLVTASRKIIEKINNREFPNESKVYKPFLQVP